MNPGDPFDQMNPLNPLSPLYPHVMGEQRPAKPLTDAQKIAVLLAVFGSLLLALVLGVWLVIG